MSARTRIGRMLSVGGAEVHVREDDCEQPVARYRRAGARVAVVEGAGHSPIIERPATTARLIRRFLAPE